MEIPVGRYLFDLRVLAPAPTSLKWCLEARGIAEALKIIKDDLKEIRLQRDPDIRPCRGCVDCKGKKVIYE